MQRDLEGARHLEEVDRALRIAVLPHRGDKAVPAPVDDLFVPARLHERDPALGFALTHGGSSLPFHNQGAREHTRGRSLPAPRIARSLPSGL
jgi:hypothetical protein